MGSDQTKKRTLAVLLHADIAGSTSLVQRDEALAHERMIDVFRRFSETINSYQGTVHEVRGDALVAEFRRASDAVCAALAFQRVNEEQNAQFTDDLRPSLRIGISLGEVVIADGTVTGAGVILAQRLEQIAEPGSVVVQGAVEETIPTRMPFEFEDLGRQELKGFDQPVRAAIVVLPAQERVPAPEPASTTPRLSSSIAKALPRADVEFPDKPSIAVLPFDNMSGDREQQYFSDGITEDIITELSRFHTLFVIARNSSFAFRGTEVDVREVGEKLGVDFIVEGSVRKVAERVRVTVQLVDVSTGHHLWAEKYDRELKDIFTVQDEITETIAASLPGRVETIGRERAERKRPSSLTAYDYVLLGTERLNRFIREDLAEARKLSQVAVDLDPRYARAHALIAATHLWELPLQSASSGALDAALASAESAVALDTQDSWSHAMLSLALLELRHDAECEVQARRAVALNPNDADANAILGVDLIYLGQLEEGLDWIAKAKRLNPFPPSWYHWYQALGLYPSGQYEEAVAALRQIRPLDTRCHAYLAACYAQMNQLEEARAEVEVFIEKRQRELEERGETLPASTLDLAVWRINRYRRQQDRDRFREGLVKAGLSE